MFRSLGNVVRAFALMLCITAFAAAIPANANANAKERVAPGCVASVPADMTLEQGTQAALNWTCDGSLPDLGPGRIAVMLGGAPAERAYFETRNGYFDVLTLAAVNGEKISASQSFDPDTIPASYTDISFAVALPTAMQRIRCQLHRCL